MKSFILNKLRQPRILERVLRERLAEPLHLNLLSLFVSVFGGLRAKIYFDLIVRQQHAYCLLAAADRAKRFGYRKVVALEFGVANGAGLLNICRIAAQITRETGVEFEIYGFDSGAGMPPAIDYRDHPDLYGAGWYPMESREVLEAALPKNASLVLGPLSETVPKFAGRLSPEEPIGFVSIDVDYYSSTVEALKVLKAPSGCYLPIVEIYLDDVMFPEHHSWAGERLAVQEFNSQRSDRKIEAANFLRERRLFKRPNWISHIYAMHVLDHPKTDDFLSNAPLEKLGNPYLGLEDAQAK